MAAIEGCCRPGPGRNAPPPPNDLAWEPPILTGGFKPRIASSVVEEFVAGRNAGDVVRELVQNEFDAGGTHVWVRFGNGRPIDSKGWSRLDVILGTGLVVGGENEDCVEPKENGIGSKNFGLRSLFLFGNRIHVRSHGRMAVLDLPAMGPQQLKDADSRGRRGVTVHVPYRSEQFQSLAPFTIEREQSALDHIEKGLLATLVKLALPGARPGIRELTLVSERTGREFAWRQNAETLKCKVKGVSVVRRMAGSAVSSGQTDNLSACGLSRRLNSPGRSRFLWNTPMFVFQLTIALQAVHSGCVSQFRSDGAGLIAPGPVISTILSKLLRAPPALP